MGACLSAVTAPRAADGGTNRPARASSSSSSSKKHEQPLFTLGVIADIQYADMADTGVEGRVQRFREAPPKLEAAVAELSGLAQAGALQGVLTLGDITNGNREDAARNPSDLETVAAILDRLPAGLPVYHVLGNHCLDLPRADVLARLRFPAGADGRASSYYSARLAPGWRLVALDTTELSGHTQAGPEAAAESAAYAAAHPLSAEEPQMSPWNGGIGRAQAAWLAGELRAASAAGDRVIVMAHHQAGPGPAVRRTHAAWNWEEISGLVSGGRVGKGGAGGGGPSTAAAVLYLAGHDHMGGYTHAGGVHWLTLEALVEAPTGSNAYATLEVYGDRVVVKGRGSASSRVLEIV